MQDIVRTLHAPETKHGNVFLRGLYTHGGHSYGCNDHFGVLRILWTEMDALSKALAVTRYFYPERRLTGSFGATPTALATQNLINPTSTAVKVSTRISSSIESSKYMEV